MRTSLFATTVFAVALSAGSAFAADLPSKKAPILPPPPPPPLWTGFYVGLNAGYTFGGSDRATFGYSDTGAGGYGASAAFGNYPGSLSLNNDGFIGGGQVGYNWQFQNSFVAGIEADIQGVASGTSTASFASPGLGGFIPASTSVSSSLDYLGTVRGRLGFLVTPTLLAYGTGGLAYGQTQLTHTTAFAVTPFFQSSSFSDTRVGWTAGGGVEWLFLPNWSAKVEYLYYDLGSVSTPALVYAYGGNVSTAQASKRFDGHVVRAGVNYHFNLFNGPAPVVAKY